MRILIENNTPQIRESLHPQVQNDDVDDVGKRRMPVKGYAASGASDLKYSGYTA